MRRRARESTPISAASRGRKKVFGPMFRMLAARGRDGSIEMSADAASCLRFGPGIPQG